MAEGSNIAVPREEALATLGLGREAWNRWKEMNRGKAIDLSQEDLHKKDLKGFDFSGVNLDKADLSGSLLDRANLSSAHLNNSNLSNASLDHANLSHAHLDRANLAFAHLENAVLLFASLKKADLRGAFLRKAAVEDAVLRNANLSHAHLEDAVLAFSDCSNVDFVNAFLNGANLTGVNLEKANVSLISFDRNILWTAIRKARFNPVKLWRRRMDLLLDTTIRCKGVHAACYGSQRFAAFLRGQDFLEEMLETRKGRFICSVWWLLADCGRSFLRWGFWSCMIVFLFGMIYSFLGVGNFHLTTISFNLGSMMYFSVVTFSTLGFGDVIPQTPIALFLTGLEVFTGYFMMGGLISIFSTKLARAAR
jgi:uncharacterized protein YjbI with pentapeptide repeats